LKHRSAFEKLFFSFPPSYVWEVSAKTRIVYIAFANSLFHEHNVCSWKTRRGFCKPKTERARLKQRSFGTKLYREGLYRGGERKGERQRREKKFRLMLRCNLGSQRAEMDFTKVNLR